MFCMCSCPYTLFLRTVIDYQDAINKLPCFTDGLKQICISLTDVLEGVENESMVAGKSDRSKVQVAQTILQTS